LGKVHLLLFFVSSLFPQKSALWLLWKGKNQKERRRRRRMKKKKKEEDTREVPGGGNVR